MRTVFDPETATRIASITTTRLVSDGHDCPPGNGLVVTVRGRQETVIREAESAGADLDHVFVLIAPRVLDHSQFHLVDDLMQGWADAFEIGTVDADLFDQLADWEDEEAGPRQVVIIEPESGPSAEPFEEDRRDD